jgi:hypothetical protein
VQSHRATILLCAWALGRPVRTGRVPWTRALALRARLALAALPARAVLPALAVMLALSTGPASAQPPAAAPSPSPAPPARANPPLTPGAPARTQTSAPPVLEKLPDGRFRLGNLVLDKQEGSITCPGKVNMQEGLIEVFACTARGKLHESALQIDVDPLHLETALLALGLEYGRALKEQGEARRPEGDPVTAWVRWGKGESAQKWRAEDLVWNVHEAKPMRHVEWVFSGSQVINGSFMAQVEGQIITTYHDPFSILDNPLEDGADDTVYEVYKDRMPPPGTPVELILVDARTQHGARE